MCVCVCLFVCVCLCVLGDALVRMFYFHRSLWLMMSILNNKLNFHCVFSSFIKTFFQLMDGYYPWNTTQILKLVVLYSTFFFFIFHFRSVGRQKFRHILLSNKADRYTLERRFMHFWRSFNGQDHSRTTVM